jgi:hypothetical protein
MVEWMDNIEMAIQKVCASKVYTSAEFKREKDNFQVPTNLSLTSTKIPLMYSFLGIAWPQSQFPHSCICERFTYSQDRSTYFLQQNRQIDHGNI